MTADSDDVAETANRKPKGSIAPPTVPPTAAARAEDLDDEAHDDARRVATGERQAEANRDADPPA